MTLILIYVMTSLGMISVSMVGHFYERNKKYAIVSAALAAVCMVGLFNVSGLINMV